MYVVDAVIAVGWVAFWLYWLVAAVGTKASRTQWGRYAALRVLAIILIALFWIRPRAHMPQRETANPWLLGIGLAFFLLGLALAVWARVYLGRNWGTPMSEKADPELVTTGPYHRVRHPIYSGIILALVGTTIAVSVYWLIAVVFLGGYFIYSAAMEERFMERTFPDTYPEYKRSTKMLVPFLF